MSCSLGNCFDPGLKGYKRYLCDKADGMANGNKVSVIPRSLMERLMMKNSAGFKVDRL